MYTFTSHSHMKSAFESGEKCADDDGNKQHTAETLSTVALPRQSEQTHFDIEKTVLKAGLKFFFFFFLVFPLVSLLLTHSSGFGSFHQSERWLLISTAEPKKRKKKRTNRTNIILASLVRNTLSLDVLFSDGDEDSNVDVESASHGTMCCMSYAICSLKTCFARSLQVLHDKYPSPNRTKNG